MNDMIEKYEKSLSRNNNSAKYVLGLSILMIKPNDKKIKFYDIADKVIDIYYNNVFKHHLVEHNKNQVPKTIQDMKNYFDIYGYPTELTSTDKLNIIKMVVENKKNGFFRYVLPCFTGAKKDDKGTYLYPTRGENEFFSYDLKEEEIILSDEFLNLIKNEYHLLKCITIDKYIDYLKRRNDNNKEISEIMNLNLNNDL